MSGCGREGFDLFTKHGRGNFFRYLRKGKFQFLMWEDTFSQIWCFIVGHKIYNTSLPNERAEWACRRCHKYIKKFKIKEIEE